MIDFLTNLFTPKCKVGEFGRSKHYFTDWTTPNCLPSGKLYQVRVCNRCGIGQKRKV